ncbi:glycosyltransferase [Synoicihabitans lomoniglobus]|uniref:Glycosyltransferase n=1 Tax=Synoicihabitans lomoniglobus TaxID=2909285 RepID=A0AAF0CNZ6_9BACT|nr:glycosyltransferase [Opitutaceae bacterium LMO-M01]WED65135.1 glycosyltransferase [Opitutaceae bacterium LMO-M01]
MKVDEVKIINVGLAGGLVALVFLRVFPEWEIAVSRWFFDPIIGWPHDAKFVVQAVYHWATLPALIMAIGGLVLALLSLRWRRFVRYRSIGIFLFAAMAMGPGVLVNAVFKEHFHRPRPREIVEFNGTAEFKRLGQVGSGERGASFPSGHASMGFFLTLPYFFFRVRRRGLAWVFLIFGTLSGLAIGMGRVMQGGHFLGDVIASGLIVWVTGRATWTWVTRPKSRAAVPAPLVMPGGSRERSIPGRIAVADRAAYLRERIIAERPLLSVIVPFYNEQDNVSDVLAEIRRRQPAAEIVAVDDGSSDATWEKINAAPDVIGLLHPRNRGQSAAILTGLHHASGEFCVLMDGDGQNDPADIDSLIGAWRDGTADVICGYRLKRRDKLSRVVASRFANAVRRLFLHDGIRDTGCSLKLFHRDVVVLLPRFNGVHRYLPAVFSRAGLRLQEVPVNHRPRSAGISKYTNWKRGLVGLYDLVGVNWLLRRHVVVPVAEVSHARRVVQL